MCSRCVGRAQSSMSAEEATEAMEKVVLGEDGQPLSKNALKKLEKVTTFSPSTNSEQEPSNAAVR